MSQSMTYYYLKAKEKLAKERYVIFKWVLAHLIRSDIENEKYEDLLRCVFGNRAYLMFYVDRIIHMVTHETYQN